MTFVKKNYLILLLLLFSFYSNTFSQNLDNKISYGLNLGMNFNAYPVSFQKLPTIPNCCSEFKTGSGIGLNFGGIFEKHFNDNFGVGVSLDYDYNNPIFKTSDYLTVSLNYEPYLAEFQHYLELRNHNIELKLNSIYNINKLFFSIGGNLNFATYSEFEQYEKIISPSNKITFLDSEGNNTFSNIRNSMIGKTPNLALLNLGLSASLGYNFLLNKNSTFILRPNLNITYYFNNLIKDIDFKRFKFGMNFSLIYSNNPQYNDSIKLIEQNNLLQNKFKDDSLLLVEKMKKLEEETNKKIILAENELKIKKELLEKQLKEQDSILNAKKNALKNNENNEIELKIIEEEKLIGHCNCYKVLYYSSFDKLEAEKALKLINSNSNYNLHLKEIKDKALNQKFYRILSKCYSNARDAINEKYYFKSLNLNLGFDILIICAQ